MSAGGPGEPEQGRLGVAAAPTTGEVFVEVARLGGAVVEEIVSSDRAEATRYLQDHDEWVVVLAGAATLDIDGVEVSLERYGWVLLRAGVPHRVVATRAGTRWLAVHGSDPLSEVE